MTQNIIDNPRSEEVRSLSRVRLLATPRTVAYQAPLSIGFSRQEYWTVLPFPSPGIFSTQGSNLGILHYKQILSEPWRNAQFSRSVMSDSLWPHELQHVRPPCQYFQKVSNFFWFLIYVNILPIKIIKKKRKNWSRFAITVKQILDK